MTIWHHLLSELRCGASDFVRWARRGTFGGFALQLAALAFHAANTGWAPAASAIGPLFVTIAGYALIAGAFAGVLGVGFRLAGWSMLAPIVLVPAGIAVAGWMMSDSIHLSQQRLAHEVGERVRQAGWMKTASQHPVVGTVWWGLMIPALVTHVALSHEAFTCALHLYILCWIAVVWGACAGGAASLPIVAVATVVRLVRRARARAVPAAEGASP